MTNSSQSRLIAGVGVGVGVTVATGLSYLYYKYMKREVMPTKWKKVGTLEELLFFPIKSCGPIEADAALCQKIGLRQGDIKDRALMLIDGGGQLVTARTYPKMFQIVPTLVNRSKIVISAPGMDDLEIDFSTVGEDSKGDLQAQMWGYNVTVMDCGDQCHTWFSQFIIGQPEGLRLVYYPYPFPTKPIDKDFRNGKFTKADTGSLQDVSSYMLINNASVLELNSRLKDRIPPRQLRGNFYVNTGGPPFEEDHWEWVKIGDEAVFRTVGPCYRCIMPNINPYSAERNVDGEPLKTLKSYRVVPGAPTKSPAMGLQLGIRALGTVKRGDTVYVEDRSK